ncbi:hypothetical protein NLU13_4259 [Sarocladium strictum]|uniref:Uncharacterized protein n=1 Tax=Sarocladium strictum TaxID=5046 RepID=A0AA39GIJ0_SARSR|nr:hypothetical protein NLU13_4259 [Sarocladium strictum]
MSAQRFFVPAAAGATALGGYLYYNSKKAPLSREDQLREKSQAKRDAGLGGAGVGQNAVTGLHEKGGPGSGVPTGNKDPSRAVKTDAPKEDLPSGGVGGGVGAGDPSTRKTVDINAKKPTYGDRDGKSGSGSDSSSGDQKSTSSSSSNNNNNNKSSGGSSGAKDSSSKSSSGASNSAQGNSSWSQSLQGIFGQGGSTAGEKDDVHKKFHDTKIHSNHADTPTKRFPGETVK